jgi:hypothetical protein
MVLLTAYSIAFIAVSFWLLWRLAFGHCRDCNLRREPRCGCSPDNSRKPWKNSGR